MLVSLKNADPLKSLSIECFSYSYHFESDDFTVLNSVF